MNTRECILIGLIILVVILFLYNKQENADSTAGSLTLSNESIQNIASVYNNQNMKVTNLEVSNNIKTNTLNATGNINASGVVVLSNNIVNASGISTPSLTINNKKIRIFDMGGYKSGNSGDANYSWVNVGASGIPIKDSLGNTYKSTEWICVVVGLYLPKDQGTSSSGAFFARASISNGQWNVQFFEGGNSSDYIRDRSIITIMAIPIEIVDTSFNSINKTVGY